VLRSRRRRPYAGRVVRSPSYNSAALAEGIRWRKEFVLFLWTSKLGVAWRSCLNALPALRSHATAIDPLRDVVFSLGFLNTLAAVGLELADPTTWRFPVVLAAARQKKSERQNEYGSLHDTSVLVVERVRACITDRLPFGGVELRLAD